MKALRIHPNPFVTAGFLVAFCMLMALLYGLPMITSLADEGEDEDATGKSLECDVNPQSCACDVRYCTPAPTPRPTCSPDPTSPNYCPQPPPTPRPTPDPTTQPPTPTTPPPTTRPTATSTPLRPPPAPTGLSGTAINCDEDHCDVKFTWPNPSDDGYRRYRIYQGHHVTGEAQAAHFGGTLLTTRGSNVTSYTKRNLDCGKTYQFRSRGEGDGVTYKRTWSSYGNKAEVTATCGEEEEPDPTPQPTSTPTLSKLDPPTTVTAGTPTHYSVPISWSSVEGASRYRVDVSKSQSNWSQAERHYTEKAAENEEAETSLTVTGLTSGTTYYFRVRTQGDGSSHSAEYGDPSDVVEATTNGFTASVKYQAQAVQGSHPEWGVLDHKYVQVSIAMTVDGDIPSDYKFSVDRQDH